MEYFTNIIKKYNKLKTHKKLSIISNTNFNTFEFIKIKNIFKRLSNPNKILINHNTWTELFPPSELRLTKVDYYINDDNYKKFISHETIGRSFESLSKNKNNIEGSIIINLKNVIIKDNSLLTLINKNLSIAEIYGDDSWLNFRLNRWPLGHNFHLAKIKIKNTNIYKRIKIYSIEKKLLNIKEKAILLSPIVEDNFFHWIFDTMSKLYFIEKIPKLKNYPLILRKPLNKYQKEMFKIFGVKNKIIFTNGKSFNANNILIPTIPSPPAYSKPLINWLRKKFLNNIKKKNTKIKRIYISRSDASHRKITNDKEISYFLEKYNFKTLILSKMKLQDQINYFRCADIIVLPHGSGGSHLLFAKKSSKIIELQSPSQINNTWCVVSKLIGCRYGFLIGDEKNNHNFNYKIDISKLKKLINKAI
jgi:hypothetical protein